MRRLLAILAVAIPLGGAGCNKETGGGASSDTQFSITGPNLSTSVVQGSDATAELVLNPGQKFTQVVKLKAEPQDNALKFVKFSDDSVNLDGKNKKTVTLSVGATKEAGTGNHVVRVTATPEKGDAVSIDVKFDVKQK
jgi:uncharacterized membrane protein